MKKIQFQETKVCRKSFFSSQTKYVETLILNVLYSIYFQGYPQMAQAQYMQQYPATAFQYPQYATPQQQGATGEL